VTALFGRWHDVARLLEHEAAVARDHEVEHGEDAEVLAKAALILRRRGDKEVELQEAERRQRMAAKPAKR
jgi:hypothetical protein